MDKRSKIILYVLVAILIGLFVMESNRPKPVNWRASYTSGDTVPLGAYVLFDNLKKLFPNASVQSTDAVPLEFLRDHEDEVGATYIFLNDYLDFDKVETDYLLDFADRGNKVFIAATSLYGPLADTLKLYASSSSYYMDTGKDTIRTRLLNPSFQDRSYVYHRSGSYRYFEEYDTLKTKVLGEVLAFNPDSNYLETLFEQQEDDLFEDLEDDSDEDESWAETKAMEIKTRKTPQVNFVEVAIGKGTIYYNLNPIAFSNYYMLNGKEQYVAESMAYLNNETIYFDDYGKSGRRVVTSPLRFILSTTSLRWAYYIAIFGILLYMIFVSKREQRIVPIVKPLENSTVEFTKTIGNLYYQSGDYTSIVDKKILFFLERVRSSYYLNTEKLDATFIRRLAAKAGKPLEETTQLIEQINLLRAKPLHNAHELKQLNKRIEAFFN